MSAKKPPASDGQLQMPVMPLSTPPAPQKAPSSASAVPMPTTSKRSGLPLAGVDAPKDRGRFRETLHGFMTGRPVEGASKGNISAQLMAAFGPSKRDPSRPDTARAAKELGTSTRTVQRWLKGDHAPRAQASKALQTKSRQAMTTKAGRARAIRASQVSSAPGISVKGLQGVRSGGQGYYRQRECAVALSPGDLQNLQDTYVAHGDNGAQAWLQQHMDHHYAEGWHIREIDGISWAPSSVYND